MVFSLLPRCHGLWGSQKYTLTLVATLNRLWSASSVPRSQGQRAHQSRGQILDLPDERADDAGGVFARDLNEHNEPGLTLHQSGDVAILATSQQIAFPVPWDRSVFHLGRALFDGDGVDNLARGAAPG